MSTTENKTLEIAPKTVAPLKAISIKFVLRFINASTAPTANHTSTPIFIKRVNTFMKEIPLSPTNIKLKIDATDKEYPYVTDDKKFNNSGTKNS